MIEKRAILPMLAAVLAFALSPAGRVSAQVPNGEQANGLTVFAAVRRALDVHPTVRRAEADYDAARATARASRAAYFPTLQLAGTLTRYEKPMVVTPLHGLSAGQFPEFDRTLLQGGLRLGFLVFDGPGRSARVRQSSAEAHVADVATRGVAQALIAQTVTAYLGVQSRREILDAHRHRVLAFEAELARVSQLQKVGQVADVDVLRIEAVLAAAGADLVSNSEMADLATRDLARLVDLSVESLGAEGLLPLRLFDSTVGTKDELMQEARKSSPELERARWQTGAASAARSVARGGRWPQLKAAANYLGFDSPDVQGAYEWNAGLELTFPLFTGGAIAAAMARASARERAAAEDERRIELQVDQAVDMALSAIRQARARAVSLARAVDRYAEVARIEKLLLESGTGTQTDYLDSRADLLTAQAGLVEARHQVIEAEVDLAKVTGILSLGWLEGKLEHTQ